MKPQTRGEFRSAVPLIMNENVIKVVITADSSVRQNLMVFCIEFVKLIHSSFCND